MINDIFYNYIDAIEFATRAHGNQTRRYGAKEPYIAHPIRVSKYILKVTEDLPLERRMMLATAAVLHDVIEDTPVKGVVIEDSFGEKVRTLVESVTKNTSLPKADKEMEFLLRFKGSPVDTVLIKLADRLDNLKSMESAPSDFQKKYLANTAQLLKALPDKALQDRHVISLYASINLLVKAYEDGM
jgi:(p)ppGpp synthase/HD superfamily hydrolase